jgi:hypothetical protein
VPLDWRNISEANTTIDRAILPKSTTELLAKFSNHEFHTTHSLRAIYSYIIGSGDDRLYRLADAGETLGEDLRAFSIGDCHLFETKDGNVGLATPDVQINDELCIIWHDKQFGQRPIFLLVRWDEYEKSFRIVGKTLLPHPKHVEHEHRRPKYVLPSNEKVCYGKLHPVFLADITLV